MITNYDTKVYNICPNCNKDKIKVDTEKLLLSIPPQYQAICCNCFNKIQLQDDEILWSN